MGTLADTRREYASAHGDVAPTMPPRYIKRPRLDATLAGLLDGTTSIACVWGAAGSGKTALIASWAHRLSSGGQLVSWVSVHDNKQASAQIRRLFEDGTDPIGESRTRFVFIDDAHLLSVNARQALARGLETVPPRLRVIVAGRYQPFTSLAFLEVTGALRELRTADLAFDASETARLAIAHDITLSTDAAGALVERTGGWATGLALAMPWIRNSEAPEQAIRQFGANHRAVADYLLTEVLRGLGDDERTVLMAGAVRGSVPLELLSVLSGRADAGEIMQVLSRRNALISEEGSDYRFHPMLLGFMQAESRRHDSAQAARNHRTAASWFAQRNDGGSALEQALASADADAVSTVLDQFGLELVLSGRTELIGQSARKQAQNDESLSSIVTRLLLQAPYALATRQGSHLFALANRQVREGTPSPTWTLALLATSCFTAAPEAVVRERLRGLCTPAAQALRASSLPLDLIAATAEGWCFDRLGRPADAAELYRQVAVAAHSAGYLWLYLLTTDLAIASLSAHGEWAQASALEDQLALSAQAELNSVNSRAAAGAVVLLAGHSYQRCEAVNVDLLDSVIAADPLGIEFGMLVPARLLRELPALDGGENQRGVAERIERISREAGHHFPRLVAAACVRIVSSRLALDGHELAREWVEYAQTVLGSGSLEVMTARYLLNPPSHVGEAAERALEEALRSDARAWHSGAAIAAWIVLAQTAHDTGREAEADARITRAVRLADRFDTPRPFLARNGEGAALVEAHLGRFGPLEPVAERIVACAAEAYPHGTDEHLIEPLTTREREILLELPVHQSVAEIARKQTLSVNTVKTHLRNIYQKLSATGRSDAVRIAHQHDLL